MRFEKVEILFLLVGRNMIMICVGDIPRDIYRDRRPRLFPSFP